MVLRHIAVALLLALFFGCVQPGGGGGGSDSPSDPVVGSISGRVAMPERVLIDSDTRDPNNIPVSNGSLAQAQAVANLVMIVGNADSVTDHDDYFSTTLNAGQTVELNVANPSSADLDLYLYQGGVQVASSTGAGKSTEKINAPGAGSFQVRVVALTGNSNYQLQLGSLSWNSLQVDNALPPKGEIVPGEVLVKMKNSDVRVTSDSHRKARSKAEGAARRHRSEVRAVSPHGLARLAFNTGVDPVGVNAKEESRQRTLDKVREMRDDPEVEYAEPNFILRPTAIPNDTHWAKQWDMVAMNLPLAWDLTTGSPSVIVAVVDTGVLYDHPDLAANILKDGPTVVGYDFISSPSSAGDGDGADPNPYDAGDEAQSSQSSFHGTHVSGTIGAAGNNGAGIAGVAWNVKIMPVRVLGRNDGTTFDVSEGVKFAAGVANSYGVLPRVGGVVTPAEVINLSLGGPDYSQPLQDAINMARSAGVIVVAAAGNSSTSANFYPAACTGVIGVSATDRVGELAPYSNYGAYVDISAPGGNTHADLDQNGEPDGILSTLGVGVHTPTSFNYVYYQGTSMASPHIAGVIALMKAYHNLFAAVGNKLTPDEVDSLIRGTVTGIDSITGYGRGYRDNYLGYGLIDAEKAVLAAGALAGHTAGLDAELTLNPKEANFGFTTTTRTVSIANNGVEQLAGIAVSPYVSTWLSHTLSGQVLTLTVNRSSLADGFYETTLTITSTNGGSANLLVSAYKGTVLTSNVGQVYVLLVNSGGNVVKTVSTSLASSYNFQLNDVKKGAYQIIAGTDLDDDGYLGDSGEFFGRYPSTDYPLAIDLSAGQDLFGRDFALGPVSTSSFVLQR